MLRTFLLLLVWTLSTTAANADILFAIAEGTSGSVDLTISATGATSTNGRLTNLLSVGTVGDTFLAPGQAQVSDLTPVPGISLGAGQGVSFAFYEDRDNYGLGSTIQFNFVSVPENADLSLLSGTYNLSDWNFSDFNPGTYSLSEGTGAIAFMSGLGTLTMVVPEPSPLLLMTAGLIFLAKRAGPGGGASSGVR
jgi:hypothetical protein